MGSRSPIRNTQGFAPARLMAVTASSLAMAGLLGACATQNPQQAEADKLPEQKSAKSGERVPVISAIKDAESALSDYARAKHRESALREAAQSAADAALVARHRQIIGAPDYLLSTNAEQRRAAAEQNLKAGEAATRTARNRLYRALGLSSDKSEGASVPVTLPADAATGSLMPLDTRSKAPQKVRSQLL